MKAKANQQEMSINEFSLAKDCRDEGLICYNSCMILVTGGTGFIGQRLIRQLSAMDYKLRVLLRPSTRSPLLPLSTPVEVAISNMQNDRALQAALNDVKLIFHLAGSEGKGARRDLTHADIESTEAIVRNAAIMGVERIVYLSHLGANQASAYPVLRAKAIAENIIIQSRIEHTIIRSSIVYGPQDHFTTAIYRLLKVSPGIFLLPGDGKTILQPVWVDDLAVALSMIYEGESRFSNQIIEIGGDEYLSFRDIISIIMQKTRTKRTFVSINPAYLRIVSLWLEQLWPTIPVSTFWIDYLAMDKITPLESLPRQFGIIPSRFENNLTYLSR